MGGALAAEFVVYVGVLLASSTAAGQPAQQINCCGYDMAGPGAARVRRASGAAITLGLNCFAIFPVPPIGLPVCSQFPNEKEKTMVCQTPNDDPCSQVTSAADAVENAQALLTAAARPGCEFWAAAAVGPLAGMLYAASPCGNNGGVGWLARAAAANTDEAVAHTAQARAARRWGASWHGAIAYLADQPMLGNALMRTLAMAPRRRDSVLMTMRDALSPWMDTGRRGSGE